jgi:hypothetical protein
MKMKIEVTYVDNTFSDSGNRMERFDLSNVKTPKNRGQIFNILLCDLVGRSTFTFNMLEYIYLFFNKFVVISQEEEVRLVPIILE